VLPPRLAVHAADPQLLPDYPHLLQVAKDIPRHSLGKIDEAVVFANVDVPNVTPLEASLVGDRADDVAGLHAVGVTYFQTEGLEHNIAVVVALAARGPRTTRITWCAWCAVAMSATAAAYTVTLGPTVTTLAVTLGPVAAMLAINLGSRGRTVITICYPSRAITVAAAALYTKVITDSAVVSKLHWTVAMIFTLQPFQREYVAVSRVLHADIAWRARLLDHSPFPAVITRIRAFFARLTTSVSGLAASLRRVCCLSARVTVLASRR